MLLRNSLSRFHQPPKFYRAMSTNVVIPFDPSGPSDSGAAKLWSLVPSHNKPGAKAPKAGTARVFYEQSGVTAVSSLGEGFAKNNANEKRESIRRAVGGGVKGLKDVVVSDENGAQVKIDVAGDAHAAAVASHLALYSFTLKTKPPSRFDPRNKEPVPEKVVFSPIQEQVAEEWERGKTYAQAQNLARTLMELPANMMTPTIFCERVKKEFEGLDNVEIIVRDEEWAASKNMNSFLSVTHGTDEPAKLLEIHYKGASSKDAQPVAFVGKGITFDSGGISLKPGAGMKLMRGDMGGAASVVAATWAVAKLKLPVNVVTVTPLTENMPGPKATKPGDVVYAMNGQSIEIDNTDAEGRLVLADAMYYTSTEYKPHTLIDVATLTGAMDIALGEIYAGVFSTSDELWNQLHAAGEVEHDRFWRMPLDDEYLPQINSSNADLMNVGGRPAGSITAAMFLKPFADGIDAEQNPLKWAHIDIAGVMEATRPTPYLEKGMSGRSVRGMIEYVRNLKN